MCPGKDRHTRCHINFDVLILSHLAHTLKVAILVGHLVLAGRHDVAVIERFLVVIQVWFAKYARYEGSQQEHLAIEEDMYEATITVMETYTLIMILIRSYK